MKTELKVAFLSIVGAVVGSALGAYASVHQASVSKMKLGYEWDLKRTEQILKMARDDDAKDDSDATFAAWACYHSILWNCVQQQWNYEAESSSELEYLCPPEAPETYKDACPING